jgi:hypothetical protein
MGYALVEVFEFWEYDVTCLDKDTSSGGLFAGYVDIFLKLKEDTQPGFKRRTTMTDTLRNTGVQRELFHTRHRFPKMLGNALWLN